MQEKRTKENKEKIKYTLYTLINIQFMGKVSLDKNKDILKREKEGGGKKTTNNII